MRTLMALLLLCSVAQAASLRPFGSVAGPVVVVADLWDDAGEAASRTLGPSPAPGERIVVEAAQLAAIARQFGVAWRPGSSAERSILERPGAPLPRPLVEAALGTALLAAGAADGELDMPDFTAPLLPPEAAPRVVVEQLSWDAASQRFAAALAVTGRNMTTLRLRVGGRVVAMAEALVATRRIAAGAVVGPGDVATGRLARERLRGEPARDAAEATGQVARRAIAAGEPVLRADIAPPAAVTKGAAVSLAINVAGIEASATGQALESGATGERIRVLNVASRAVLLAEVTGPGTARVAPGSRPLRGTGLLP